MHAEYTEIGMQLDSLTKSAGVIAYGVTAFLREKMLYTMLQGQLTLPLPANKDTKFY